MNETTRTVAHRYGYLITKLIKRLLWKREVERLKHRISNLERLVAIAEKEARFYERLYHSNLAELSKQDALIRQLRFRLSEVGRPERKRLIMLP